MCSDAAEEVRLLSNTGDALRMGELRYHIRSTLDQSNGEEETDNTGMKKDRGEN